MIWDVKMIWPKLKDSKGKELTLTNKKSLLTKTSPDTTKWEFPDLESSYTLNQISCFETG